jgi:hypothetical protein
MAYEIKDKHGDTVKMGGKLTEQDPGKELTDWAEYPQMPEAPSQKYDK